MSPSIPTVLGLRSRERVVFRLSAVQCTRQETGRTQTRLEPTEHAQSRIAASAGSYVAPVSRVPGTPSTNSNNNSGSPRSSSYSGGRIALVRRLNRMARLFTSPRNLQKRRCSTLAAIPESALKVERSDDGSRWYRDLHSDLGEQNNFCDQCRSGEVETHW
jgi:hypothetical protein